MAHRRPRRLLDLMTWEGRRKATTTFRIANNADDHHASAGRALRAGVVNARRPRSRSRGGSEPEVDATRYLVVSGRQCLRVKPKPFQPPPPLPNGPMAWMGQ